MAEQVPLDNEVTSIHFYPAPAPTADDEDRGSSISITLNSNQTAMKEISNCPIGIIFQVGLVPYSENLKVINSSMQPWTNQIKKLDIIGPVYSPFNLWELLVEFKNLESLDWNIVSCGGGSGFSTAEIDERNLVENNSIQEIKIQADFETFKTSTVHEKDFILAMIKYSSNMALRCPQLTKFNFDLPLGDTEEVYFMVRNFLNHTRFDVKPIERNLEQRRVTCVYPEL